MIEISFTGDIAFSKYFKDSWNKPDLIDEQLINFLSSSDYVVPNVEGALTSSVMTRGSSEIPAHASNPESVAWLLRMKGNIWNLSNNHTLDCGKKGLEDTINLAHKNNCRTLGVGMNIQEAAKPIILNEVGGIGLIAVCYKELFKADSDKPGIVYWDDFTRIKSMIKKIKKEHRWCILIVHGGEEFSSIPMPNARNKYLKYLKFGADIIVGHHPHVPQNYETVGKKIIFYSLGNFIFDTDYQRLQKNTDIGILLKLILSENDYSFEYMPYKIDRVSGKVIKGERPAVFRNINAKEYRKLALPAINEFLKDYSKAKIFLKPYMKDYSSFQWMMWYIKNKGFWTLLGRFYNIKFILFRQMICQRKKNKIKSKKNNSFGKRFK